MNSPYTRAMQRIEEAKKAENQNTLRKNTLRKTALLKKAQAARKTRRVAQEAQEAKERAKRLEQWGELPSPKPASGMQRPELRTHGPFQRPGIVGRDSSYANRWLLGQNPGQNPGQKIYANLDFPAGEPTRLLPTQETTLYSKIDHKATARSDSRRSDSRSGGRRRTKRKRISKATSKATRKSKRISKATRKSKATQNKKTKRKRTLRKK